MLNSRLRTPACFDSSRVRGGLLAAATQGACEEALVFGRGTRSGGKAARQAGAPAGLEKTFVIRSARKQCLSAKTKHYRQFTGYFAGGCVYGSCARLNTLIVWLA